MTQEVTLTMPSKTKGNKHTLRCAHHLHGHVHRRLLSPSLTPQKPGRDLDVIFKVSGFYTDVERLRSKATNHFKLYTSLAYVTSHQVTIH